MNTSALANFFNKQREIIEAAEAPFAKLAVFVLPVLTPMVPAFVTGVHIFQLFIEIFTFTNSDLVSSVMAVVIAVSLELLGYVGAVSFIKSLFDWVRTKEDEYLLPMVLNGIAYLFYLGCMYLINVQLGSYFGTPSIVNTILGLLSFITVPSSLLAANHLNDVSSTEREDKLRSEKRADELEKYRLKQTSRAERSSQTSPRVSSQPRRLPQTSPQSQLTSTLSENALEIFSLLDKTYKKDERVLSSSEIVLKGYDKSTAWRHRNKWLENHPDIKKRLGF